MLWIQKFFKKGGGVGVEGIGMRNMNIVVLSYGWEFMYMYVGVDFIQCIYWVCFEMMEVYVSFCIFFLRGEGGGCLGI